MNASRRYLAIAKVIACFTGVVFTFPGMPAQAEPSPGKSPSVKVGASRALPSLQTRARPPLLPPRLYVGMLEPSFFAYAQDNNWLAIATERRQESVCHHLAPGGEGLYALPDLDLVYARGFTVRVCFQQGRLVGMHLLADPREEALTPDRLLALVRAWFPDNAVSAIYQVLPDDPKLQVVEAAIGQLPPEFAADFGRTKLRVCRTVLFPAPLPVQTLPPICLAG